jgi:DNA polymerase-3 subunit beta
MTEFTVLQKQLALAVKGAGKVLPKRPHLPILSGIKCEVKDRTLTLTTTDLVSGFKTSIEVETEVETTFVVNGKSLAESVNFFDAEETKFKITEKELELCNGRDMVAIPLLTDDFPDFQVPDLPRQETQVTWWQQIVRKVGFAAGADQSRPALTGVLMQKQAEKTQIVCTDGFRLAIWRSADLSVEWGEKPLIMSAKAVADVVALADLFSLKKIDFVYDESGEQVFLVSAAVTYLSKTISGNYPPYERIVPLEFKTEITLDRLELLKNLAKAAVFTKVDNNIVKLAIVGDEMKFSAATLGEGNFRGQQDVLKKVGGDLEIAFNIRYLTDFLNTVGGEQVWVGLNESTTPVMMRDVEEGGRDYVTMPFKPKG